MREKYTFSLGNFQIPTYISVPCILTCKFLEFFNSILVDWSMLLLFV
jgi:hypothetical protein